MPLMYPIKHVYRNWKLFTALLIGITLAATFFASIGIKANVAADQAINAQISSVLTDISFDVNLNRTNLASAYKDITQIEGVKQVDNLVRINSRPVRSMGDNFTRLWVPQIVSFPNTSQINDEWINKPIGDIPENYTYLIADTELAKNVTIGDTIVTSFVFNTLKYYNQTTIYVNLTVAGFAQLTNKGYALVSGVPYYNDVVGGGFSSWRGDMLIVSWNNTFMKLWKTTPDTSITSIYFAVNLDREALINPWDVSNSITKIQTIGDKIENKILGNYLAQTYVSKNLYNQIQSFQSSFSFTMLNFFLVSIPVFFVAWYLGSTVSDVSFNIRRREIGLLSTKGLSSGQIQRMFLTEALFIGLVGGALGVIGGIIINQYYAGSIDLNTLFTSRSYDPTVMIATIAFGVVLAIISVFLSARRAARLPAVDALRNYMPTDVNKSGRRIFPIIALIIGTYQIVVFAAGINIPALINQAAAVGGFYFSFIQGALNLVNAVLVFVGPFLFFWGLTKLLIRDSVKFQALVSKISGVFGELGALAAKNVRRNPARLAAIAFLIALIIGYSVQVTGQIASQQDYTVRQVRSDVGADVTVSIVNASKGQLILNEILANVSGIQNGTIERSLNPSFSNYGTLSVRAIDPENWSVSVYYESQWFTGNSVEQALKEMKGNNNTIILDRTVAKQLNKNLYDEVSVNFNSCPRTLRIVGFFGHEPSANSGGSIVRQGGPGVVYYSGEGQVSSIMPPDNYMYSHYYSYVPNNLFNVSSPFSDIYEVEQFQTTLRFKLAPGANGTDIANQISALEGFEVYSVLSFDQSWRQSQQMNNLSTFGSLQILDIQGLGLLFAVLSASVGTALIAIVSLRERSREATLLSVRGLSYRQLVFMFLTESLAIITFAVILGIIVGVIIVYGNITIANSNMGSLPQLVTQRLIYPANALATIGTYVALIYAATIGAIIVMTSQYVTKLEKMVRTK